MPPDAVDPLPGLLLFNRQLLAQARALVAVHARAGGPRYAGPVGSHLRHVIEHHEALLLPADPGVVDYDGRARDAVLEVCAALATQRLERLDAALADAPRWALHEPVRVRGLGGLAGDFGFEVDSSIGRELAFVASHAVHHFALLAGHCREQGIALPEGFGRAPATRAHERAVQHQAVAGVQAEASHQA